jgi:mandelamide amidase
VLQTLLSAGALLMGKTNLHELSLGVTSNNPTFGPCHNPYDATRASGGSSGGSAAAVSARLAPLAVGEDTTCSIRVPAAWCGVAGLRPTTRRYPQDGIMPITPRFDSVGPIARSVSDLLLFDQVLRPDDQGAPEPSLRGLRLGAPPDYWSGLDADVERISLDALRRLTEAGAQVVHAPLPGELKDDLSTVMDILSYEVVANETGFLRDQETGVTFQQMYEELSAPLRSRFDESFLEGSRHPIPLERYRAAVERLTVLRTRMEAYFTDNKLAALVYPPAMIAAVPIGVETDIRIGAVPSTVRTALLRNTVHASAIGMPGLVLPAGLTNSGLPVGIEFDALRGKDRALLALGLSLERALGPVPPPTLRAS